MSEEKSFFSTLPGIITALAGLVTAIAGLIVALSQSGFIGSRGKEETKPEAVAPSQPVAARTPEAPKKPVAPQPVAEPPKASVVGNPEMGTGYFNREGAQSGGPGRGSVGES